MADRRVRPLATGAAGRRVLVVVAVLCSTVWAGCAGSRAAAYAEDLAPAPAPPTVREFRLADAEGKEHGVREWEGSGAIVLFFVGPECPVSNGYAPEMARLARAFERRRFLFYAVHADPDVTAEAARLHAREYGLAFPVLLDPELSVARQSGVARIPTAVVLAPTGRVLYRGRIDDRYAPDGKRRDAPTRCDLREFLEKLPFKEDPGLTETPVFGCPLPTPPSGTADPKAAAPSTPVAPKPPGR